MKHFDSRRIQLQCISGGKYYPNTANYFMEPQRTPNGNLTALLVSHTDSFHLARRFSSGFLIDGTFENQSLEDAQGQHIHPAAVAQLLVFEEAVEHAKSKKDAALTTVKIIANPEEFEQEIQSLKLAGIDSYLFEYWIGYKFV